MSDDMERQINVEEQRARMQAILRDANMAIIIALDNEGMLATAYMNCNSIDILGLSKALYDNAPAMARGRYED